MSGRTVFLLSVALAAGVSSSWLIERGSHATPVARSVPAASDTKLARPEPPQPGLPPALRLTVRRSSPDAESATESDDRQRNTPADDQLGPKEQDTWAATRLDETLKRESVDATWSRAMDARAGEFFASSMASGSTLHRMECKTTLCRLEVSNETIDARERFGKHFSTMIPPSGAAFVHIEDSTSLNITVYIASDQSSLPRY
jgi:hypothetical protein